MIFNNIFTPGIIILIIWSAIWKFVALWKAGRNNQLTWFVFIAVLNTLGILEIIYLAFFQKNLNKRKK
jgi:methionyl-tRNA synthetase